jgi:hypothetical protein
MFIFIQGSQLSGLENAPKQPAKLVPAAQKAQVQQEEEEEEEEDDDGGMEAIQARIAALRTA